MTKKKLIILFILCLIFLPIKTYGQEDLISIKEIRGEKNYFYDRVFKSRSSIVRDFSKRNNKPTETYSKNLENQDLLKDLIGKELILQEEGGNWFTKIHFREEAGTFDLSYKYEDESTIYLTNGLGKFEVSQKIDDLTYSLKLVDYLHIGNVPFSDKDEKKYESVEVPYGFQTNDPTENEICRDYTLYLPFKKRNQMENAVNEWIGFPSRTKYIDEDESRVYILVNDQLKFPFIENVE
ncbi:hypothetical protein I6H45_04245 [Anaerococcus vaginalis]|uniref:Uncharacterized protein n=2 Tax=Anaerococcus vaginalis TaxID=33037 RepID=C7HTQ8_9FIRM|nr:hypothetical protein [Anaerococcus vaginalis]EEU12939.1 hypothetical protein HMPREF0078_0659 [Anaerococcus vaginalis ATCC 51170]QQB62693.1 hypothetical protein I6H45_04245 [Anaerococcus vaginalis]